MKTSLIVAMMFVSYVAATNKNWDGDEWYYQKMINPTKQCMFVSCKEDKTKADKGQVYECQYLFQEKDANNKLVDGVDYTYFKVPPGHPNVAIVTDEKYEEETGYIGTVEDIEGADMKIKKVYVENESTGDKTIYCVTDKMKITDLTKKVLDENCNEEGMNYLKNDCEPLKNKD